jgi:hypothetical protein
MTLSETCRTRVRYVISGDPLPWETTLDGDVSPAVARDILALRHRRAWEGEIFIVWCSVEAKDAHPEIEDEKEVA